MENQSVKQTQPRGVRQWVRDTIYGAVLILFSIGNIIYASTLGPGSIKLKVAQAGTYLTIVMVLLGFLGVCLIVRALTQKPDNRCEPIFNRTTLITIAIVALYLLILSKLGFLISSFLLLFSLITYYSWEQATEKPSGKPLLKKLAQYALCAIITTAVCYYLFGTVLTVVLPQFTLF